MVDDIVHELETSGREVLSSLIGARVLEKLREIDEVAYLRYASVYQRFQDVDQFVDAIHTLGRRIKPNALQRELFPPETMKEKANANVAHRSRERAIKNHGRV
jgi:transcriptional repressor NrdR